MRELLAILPILGAIGFFNYHGMFSPGLQKFMLYFFVTVAAVYAWLYPTKEAKTVRYPRIAWILLLGSIVVSMFMSMIIHEQTLKIAFVSTLQFLFPYSFFLVLLKLAPDPKKLIKWMLPIVGCSILVYFANFRSFPATVFGYTLEEDMSRGILRVPIPLYQLLILMFFYCINRYDLTRRPIWLLCIATGGIMIILSVVRQIILVCGVLGFIMFMRRYSWTKKIIIGSILASAALIAFTKLPFYKDIMELSEDQYEATASEEEEDVRIGAWRYYAFEAQQENPAAIPFGNGVAALDISKWGKDLTAFFDSTGFLYADVSWAGIIYHFGIIGTAALLYIVFAAIFKKKRREQLYLTYYMIAEALFGIASGVWEYFYEIDIIMLALYLIYAPQNAQTDKEPAPAEPRDAIAASEPTKFITR